MSMKNHNNERRIDPVLMTDILILLGALGSIASIGSFMLSGVNRYERKKKEKVDWERQDQCQKEFNQDLIGICRSARDMQKQILNLQNIIYHADQEYLSNPAKFGGKPLYLTNSGFHYFEISQDRLIQDLREITYHVGVIERFLANNPDWCETYTATRLGEHIEYITVHIDEVLANCMQMDFHECFAHIYRICEMVEDIEKYAEDGILFV